MDKINNKLPLVEFNTNLIYAIGLVDEPAIESDFLFFSGEQIETLKFTANEEKMELLGAAMIPNKKILRVNPETKKPYYGVFTVEDIRKNAQQFSLSGYHQNLNINHTDEDAKSYVFQSYIVEDYHIEGLAKTGLDVPVGSWIVGVKITDKNVWNKVKSGDIKGFSVEGLFTLKEIDESELDAEIFQAIAEYNNALKKSNSLLNNK